MKFSKNVLFIISAIIFATLLIIVGVVITKTSTHTIKKSTPIIHTSEKKEEKTNDVAKKADIDTTAKNTATLNIHKTEKFLETKAPNLNHKVLHLALVAYDKALKQGYDKKHILSVIDFSVPTYHRTLWIFNLNNDDLLFNTYVAHGKNSGNTVATKFSNTPGSLESSLGLYLTGSTYYGNDGLSMRLHGLSGNFNDNVYERAVVMHGAWYVSRSFVKEYHRVGRSWGCTAVSKSLIKPITNDIKDGTLIFAYADNQTWLDHGPYVSSNA